MSLLSQLFHTFIKTIYDVLPILGIIATFQFLVIRKPLPNLKKILIGSGFVILGLTLFLVGLEKALFPLGREMALQLVNHSQDNAIDLQGQWQNYLWVLIFAFCIGFSTTIAEPSLLTIAIKANEVSGGSIGILGLRVAVALGVAFGITLGCYRIIVGEPIQYYILSGYTFVIVQTWFTPKLIVPLAYDSGGVTTSTVTVPLIAALGLGLAETVSGRNPLIDGFGLIAFASLFPIISVISYAQLSEAKIFFSQLNKNRLIKRKLKMQQQFDEP